MNGNNYMEQGAARLPNGNLRPEVRAALREWIAPMPMGDLSDGMINAFAKGWEAAKTNAARRTPSACSPASRKSILTPAAVRQQWHERVTDAMESQGIGKKELAGRMNVSPSLITKWTDRSHNPTLETMGNLAYQLGLVLRLELLDPREILQGNDKERHEP